MQRRLEMWREISGGFRCPGPSYAQDSYRNELAGLLALLSIVRAAFRWFHVQRGFLHLACDGKGALSRLFQQNRPASMTDSQWDMVQAAKELLEEMPGLELTWHHVKGHQDTSKDVNELNIWARWNILCDARAKYVRRNIAAIPNIPRLTTRVRIRMDRIETVTNTVHMLREHCLNPAALEYWQKTGALGTAEPEDVDWECLGRALKEMDPYRRRFVSKHSTGWCGVGVNLQRWQNDPDDKCPCCGQPAEDAEHVWRCSAGPVLEKWDELMVDLQQWFIDRDTEPELAQVLLNKLCSWKGGRRFASGPIRSRRIHQAVIKQDTIGWRAAFEGRWTVHIAQVQQRHYHNKRSSRTGKRWLTELIKKQWSIAWDLWEFRNGVKEGVRDAADRQRLARRVEEAYGTGPDGLFATSRRLFESKSLTERLGQSNQQLAAWLLRVEAAQARAALDPHRVRQGP